MVSTLGVPIVDYSLAVKNQANLMAQFQKWPSYAQSVTYYRDNIGKVTSVDDLLNNPKVLNVALTAFNIDPSTVTPDTLRRLLTEPTTSPTTNPTAPSLATDPVATADLRLAQFAYTF